MAVFVEGSEEAKRLGKIGFFIPDGVDNKVGKWVDCNGEDLDPDVRQSKLDEQMRELQAKMDLLKLGYIQPTPVSIPTPDMIDPKPAVYETVDKPNPIGRPKGS